MTGHPYTRGRDRNEQEYTVQGAPRDVEQARTQTVRQQGPCGLSTAVVNVVAECSAA